VQLTDVGYILRVKLGQNADQRRILQFPGQNVSTERVPAASLARLAAGSSIGLTNTWRSMFSFDLLMTDGKPVWNM